jgi:DNA primase
MGGMISKRTIDDVIQTARVEEVINDFMTIKRKGTNFEGLCPFHDEKTPSFKVSPAKGLYKCFGCGKAGGPVQFVMDHENASFAEAIRYLANKYGIEVVEDSSKKGQLADEEYKHRESLLAALHFAQQFFCTELRTEDGKISGLQYFKERGFTEETIQTFGLGFAPKGIDLLYKAAIGMGFKTEILSEAGLIKTNDKGYHYDFFRERVTFPFYNISGKVIAFGGRILSSQTKGPKYLNSPETPVYIKSKTLFGLFQAKSFIKKEDHCLLVEGYTDVISLYQKDIKNAIASSGTSLTREQAALISRFTQNVTLLFDGDTAGIKASIRGVDILVEQGLNVRIITLKEGEDPDSFAKSHDVEDIKRYLKEQQKDFILFKADWLYKEAGSDPIKKAEANADIIQTIALVPNPLVRAEYMRNLAQIAQISEPIIHAEVSKYRLQKDTTANQQVMTDLEYISRHATSLPQSNPVQQWNSAPQEMAIAEKLIRYASLPYNQHMNVAEYVIFELDKDENAPFDNPQAEKIVQYVKKQLEQQIPFEFQSLTHNSDKSLSEFIASHMQDDHELSDGWEQNEIFIAKPEENYKMDVFENIFYLKLARLRKLIHTYHQQIKHSEEEERWQNLSVFMELSRVKKNLETIKSMTITL